MLVGMVMRPGGAVAQGIPGAVVAAQPAVNILPVSFVFDGSFCDTKFFSILNQG